MKKITLFFVAIVLLISHATVAQSSGEDIDNNAMNPAAISSYVIQEEICCVVALNPLITAKFI